MGLSKLFPNVIVEKSIHCKRSKLTKCSHSVWKTYYVIQFQLSLKLGVMPIKYTDRQAHSSKQASFRNGETPKFKDSRQNQGS